MAMVDLRAVLVLCCFLQLGRLTHPPLLYVCPPEFPHQASMTTCFSLNEEYLTFDEAQASCIAKGGKLAEPRVLGDVDELTLFIRDKDTYQGYWVGLTDVTVPGVLAYASDNSPVPEDILRYDVDIKNFDPLDGRDCFMYWWKSIWGGDYQSTHCEEKARSVCQHEPTMKVCGVGERMSFISFNFERHIYEYMLLPCDYTLASIVCGDYDVRVYGTSQPIRSSKGLSSLVSARVVVQRATTQETVVSAKVTRDAIAKSKDGKNLWTVTDGTWTTEVSDAFEPARQAAVIKIGDVGQVDFSASNDTTGYGLYVLCKDLRLSVEFPEALCEYVHGTSNWSRQIEQLNSYPERVSLFMRAIFLQNAGKQLQCSEIAKKVQSCPDAKTAVLTCFVIFWDTRMARCFAGDKVWFERCIDAHCSKNVDKCKELKTKITDCRLSRLNNPGCIRPFMNLLNTC